MSLAAHLLIHVRDCSDRSKKNPKFYENLIFYSVPKNTQAFPVSNYSVFIIKVGFHVYLTWKSMRAKQKSIFSFELIYADRFSEFFLFWSRPFPDAARKTYSDDRFDFDSSGIY